jgi:hypothetical protein
MLLGMQIWVVLPLLMVVGYLLYLAGVFRGRHQPASGDGGHATRPGDGSDGTFLYTFSDSGGSSHGSGECAADGGGDSGGGDCGGGGDGGGGGGSD